MTKKLVSLIGHCYKNAGLCLVWSPFWWTVLPHGQEWLLFPSLLLVYFPLIYVDSFWACSSWATELSLGRVHIICPWSANLGSLVISSLYHKNNGLITVFKVSSWPHTSEVSKPSETMSHQCVSYLFFIPKKGCYSCLEEIRYSHSWHLVTALVVHVSAPCI